MAGAGYKLFNTGDVLTAAQVNTYLQEQAVMRFANAAARTTALSGVLAEGMMSYLDDTNSVEVYNGSAWVSVSSDQTPLTTKGDLFTYSTTDARLAVGNNGESLVADSSTSTGLRWNPTATMANPIINGGVDIWQRGTSFTGSNTYIYTADRWAWRDTSGGLQTIGQVTSSLPDGFQYGIRMGRNSGVTSTSAQILQLPLETPNSIPYANQTITMSFYAKKGANFSPTQLSVILYSGTGTNQSVGGTTGGAGSWTGSSAIINTSIAAATLTTSWVRYSYTVTVGSTATQLAPHFQTTGVGTAGADDFIYLTGVQIDLGSVALPFRRSGGTLAGELAACQRYYYRITNSAGDRLANNGYAASTSTVRLLNRFPVTMRVKPTALEQSGTAGDYGIAYAATGIVCTSVPTFLNSSVDHAMTTFTATSPFSVGAGAEGYAQNATGYLGWSAEL